MSTKNDRSVLNSILNPLVPIGEDCEYDEISQIDTEVATAEVKGLEAEGAKKADNGDLDGAIDMFSRAIDLCPGRASCYNNRAQAFRLAGWPAKALSDLDKAIQLSGGRGRAGCQAYSQRGVMYRKEGRDDEAMEDFKAAAALGSGFAKTMLVQMNPYAAMCNAMLHKVFTDMQDGADTEIAKKMDQAG